MPNIAVFFEDVQRKFEGVAHLCKGRVTRRLCDPVRSFVFAAALLSLQAAQVGMQHFGTQPMQHEALPGGKR